MRSRLVVFALLAAMPLLFAPNVLIGRATAETIAPWTLAFWRWALAGLMVLPSAARGLMDNRRALRVALTEVFLLAFLGMAICGGVVYLSLHATTATNGMLIYTASPLIVVVIEAAFFGERFTPARLAGTMVGFLGVAVIVLEGEPGRLLAFHFNPGDLGMALCAAAWALYSVLLKRGRARTIPALPLFAASAIAGALLLVPPMAWEAWHGAFPTRADQWTNIVALALVPSVLAYGVFQYGVQTVGPSATTAFMYLLPVYGVTLAALTLGEAIHPYHAIALVLVVAGVALATNPFVRTRSA